MNDYDFLVMEIELLTAEIAARQAELEDLKARRREMDADAAVGDSPYWAPTGDRDPVATYHNKQIEAMRVLLEASGSRVDKLILGQPEFNAAFAVTMSDSMNGVSPEYMKLYAHEQSQHLGRGMLGSLSRHGFTVDAVDDEAGLAIEDVLIPWAGNAGPVEARRRLEAFWADPERLSKLRRDFEYRLLRADFYYRRAQAKGTSEAMEEFNRNFPGYVES